MDGAVGIITINRPKALNALNEDVLNELEQAFDAVDLGAVRCLILTGAGEKSFVAGADIGAMSTMTKAEGAAFGKKGNDIFLKIEKFPIPVIAAINGFALGGGCEISMSCDIRICSENAIFGQPEVSVQRNGTRERDRSLSHLFRDEFPEMFPLMVTDRIGNGSHHGDQGN